MRRFLKEHVGLTRMPWIEVAIHTSSLTTPGKTLKIREGVENENKLVQPPLFAKCPDKLRPKIPPTNRQVLPPLTPIEKGGK